MIDCRRSSERKAISIFRIVAVGRLLAPTAGVAWQVLLKHDKSLSET